jgi:hypothetical protein
VKLKGRRQFPVCGLFAGMLVLAAGCGDLSQGPPTNLLLTAASDTTIRISWTPPAGTVPDSYTVSFMETGSSTWLDVGSAADSAIQADHNPLGRTGRYRVSSVFGSQSYAADRTPTSAPVYTSASMIGELNSALYSGMGWDRDSGTGSIFTMGHASNAGRVDFYLTDWSAGSAGPDYYAASPDWGPYEPGGTGQVPVGTWRPNWFIAPFDSGQAPLPAFDSTRYANHLKLGSDSTLVGMVCTDTFVIIDSTGTGGVADTFVRTRRHYALLKFGSPDSVSGSVRVESWFQRIGDLRLIQH